MAATVPSTTAPQTASSSGLVTRLRFRRAPLAAAALWFALGIGLRHVSAVSAPFHPTPLLVAALACLFTLGVVGVMRSHRTAWIPVAGLWLLLGLVAAEWQPSPANPRALLGYADNLSRDVQARVVRVRPAQPVPDSADDADKAPPWEMAEDSPARADAAPLSMDLAVDAVEDVTPDTSTMVQVDGGIRVSVYDAQALDLRCGDRLELPLRLKPPQRFRDPGAFQLTDLLLSHGIAVESSVNAARIVRTGSSPATLSCRIFAAQTWASSRLTSLATSPANRRLPPALRLSLTDAAMLNAMLFGDRAGLTHTLRVGFERTGTFHLFVVSGLHIALLAGGVFWLLRRMGLPLWLATFATIAAAMGYTVLTGFGQPAQRSLVMVSVYLLARLMSRDRDSLNALGAAVLVLLVWSPGSLFDASFQMTALAILGIAGIAIPLGDYTFLRMADITRDVFERPRTRFTPREAQLRLRLELWGEALAELLGGWSLRLPATLFRWTLRVLELALIATVAELVMVLPMALYFHRAAVFALPANMVVIPVLSVLAPAAVLTFLCSLVSPWLAAVPGAVTSGLLHAVTWTIHLLSRRTNPGWLDPDLRLPGPVWWVAVLAVVAWVACCWAVRRSRLGALATAFALPLIATAVLWPEPAVVTPGALEVSAIDVGQGDSLLAVNPDGEAMLIDAGGPVGRGPGQAISSFDIGEQVVSPYLWSRRFRRIDIMVLTHAHSDHMGGMPSVLANFRPRELWVGVDAHSPNYAALLAEAYRLHIIVRHLRAGDRQRWGSVAVSVLAPAADYGNLGSPKNDDSLVLELALGRATALLEGDAEAHSEQAMLAAGLVQPVTLLKLGHHGSLTSSTEAFLDAAHPREAVVSVGRRNTFGHPRGEIIHRLAARGTRLFRTDQFGLTTFLLTPDGRVSEVVDGVPLPRRD